MLGNVWTTTSMLTVFTGVYIVIEASWVQIRLQIPEPGDPNYNTKYRPIKAEDVKILDDDGKALPYSETETTSKNGDEIKGKRVEESGQLHGNETDAEFGPVAVLNALSKLETENDGTPHSNNNTGYGNKSQLVEDKSLISGGSPSDRSNSYMDPILHGTSNAVESTSTEKPNSNSMLLGRSLSTPNNVLQNSNKMETTSLQQGVHTDASKNQPCVFSDPPFADKQNPEYYHLCIKQGKDFFLIKVKCPIGTFNNDEHLCIWSPPPQDWIPISRVP